MLDGAIRRRIDPWLDRAARRLARAGITADGLSLLGFALGLACAGAIAARGDAVALALLASSRLADGLDGAVARAGRGATARGGFLDIVLDFAFYGAVPLAFALRDPATNALPACALLFAFYVNGASFLALAAVAGKQGLVTGECGSKSFYFTAGLAEGTETILAFAAMIAWPEAFPALALAFAALCLVSAIARALLALKVLR